MPTNFSNIGFNINFSGLDNKQVVEMLFSLFKDKFKHQSKKIEINDDYIAYKTKDESGGVLYWYIKRHFLYGKLSFVDLVPGFDGNVYQEVNSVKYIENQNTGFEKIISLWMGKNRDDGGYPLTVALPGYYLENISKLDSVEKIQITLFSFNNIEIYKNEEEFEKSHPRNEQGIGMSSKVFIPSGNFPPFNEESEENKEDFVPQPECLCYGKVVSAEKLPNKIGGGDFWHIILDTYAAKYDVVADAELLKEEPKEGEIIGGSFYVSGRLDNGPNKIANGLKFVQIMITVAVTVAIAVLLTFLK